jgi:hypothetical protein
VKFLLSKNIKLLILTIILLTLPITAWGSIGNDDHFKDEYDLHAPDTELFYIRQIPNILFADAKVVNGQINIPKPIWAWADTYSSREYGIIPGEDRTHVLTLTYLKRNDGIILPPLVAEQEFILPVPSLGHAGHFQNHKLPESIAPDASPAVYARGMMPSREDFAQQDNGITNDIAEQFGLHAYITQPNIFNEQYYKVAGTATFHGLYYQLETDHDSNNNWEESKKPPYWDDWKPEYDADGNVVNREEAFAPGKSFYRGRQWSNQLGIE